MSIIRIDTLGTVTVDYDGGSPLPDESYILASPNGTKWTLLANGTTGAVTLTDGAAGSSVRLSLFDSMRNEWLVTVDDLGVLSVTSAPGPIVFSPIGNRQFKTETGQIAGGYLLFVYAAGDGFTPITTYKSRSFSLAQSNPIVLNANGFPTDPIFIELGTFYKFILALPGSIDPPSSSVYTWDGVNGGALVNRASPTEFLSQSITISVLSETMFSVTNDQRTSFAVGRRMQFPGASTLDGTVISTPFFDGDTTTVTVAMDSGILDGTMTQVYPAMLQPQHSGIPSRQTVGTRTRLSGSLTMPVTALFNLLPAGIIFEYDGSDQPSGWLRCDGSSYLRASLPELFSSIGTSHGAVDGTHFNVPDGRGRMLLGCDIMGGIGPAGRVTSASVGGVNAITLGGTGGEETHVVTVDEYPIHNHGKTLSAGSLTNSDEAGATNASSVKRSDFSVQSAGGDAAHNTMPPWEAKQYLIFANA